MLLGFITKLIFEYNNKYYQVQQNPTIFSFELPKLEKSWKQYWANISLALKEFLIEMI